MDEVTLTIPRERPFYGVAHLVLNGLASRLDATYESLQDLELALDTLLERENAAPQMTLTLRVADGALEALLGPFADEPLRRELEREAEPGVGLRRILETVADRVTLDERDGANWVTLHKRLRPEAGSG